MIISKRIIKEVYPFKTTTITPIVKPVKLSVENSKIKLESEMTLAERALHRYNKNNK